MSKEGNTGAKIHCAVCGRTFDAAADKCPNCSAPASLSQPVFEPREEKREPVFVCTICGHVDEGKAAAEAERQHKLREADAQTTALARAMCEKLLSRNLTEQDDSRLLDDLLEKAGAEHGN